MIHPEDFTCPRCGARPGQGCVQPSGILRAELYRPPHAVRIARAKRRADPTSVDTGRPGPNGDTPTVEVPATTTTNGEVKQ